MFSQSTINQFLTPSDTLNHTRLKGVYITQTALLTSSLIGLNQLWYADYQRSSFHFKNDNNQWLQLDKLGHLYSSFHLAATGANTLKWAGASQKQQLIIGTSTALGFLTAVEVFDGFSTKWGASFGDVLANTTGAALFVSQQLLWSECRIVPKFSYQKSNFPSIRPDVFGNTLTSQILKDYNAQTYWLSANIHSFIKLNFVPVWLNFAIGYGGANMLFSTKKDALANGVVQNEYRQFYLSFDVDLTKIKTKSPFLKTVFSVFNTLKIPAPTLQLNANRHTRGYLFYF
ncbi:MAG TPA: DUF2279 domain-containing protein [Flavobacterium sp.]|nr:DUF2279 domain-containing protein [Flavobacterium sp.]